MNNKKSLEPGKALIKKVRKAIKIYPPKGTSGIIREAFNKLLGDQLREYRFGKLDRVSKFQPRDFVFLSKSVLVRREKSMKYAFELALLNILELYEGSKEQKRQQKDFGVSSIKKKGGTYKFYMLPKWVLDKCKRKTIWKRVVDKKKILKSDMTLEELSEKILEEALARAFLKLENDDVEFLEVFSQYLRSIGAKWEDLFKIFFKLAETHVNAKFNKNELARALGKNVKQTPKDETLDNLESRINKQKWSSNKRDCARQIAECLAELEMLGVAVDQQSLKKGRFKKLVEAADEVDVVWSVVMILKRRFEKG